MMIKTLEKYKGHAVELIYLDKSGQLTQRKVLVHSIKGDRVRVYCLERQAPRVLLIDSILAVQPVLHRAS